MMLITPDHKEMFVYSCGTVGCGYQSISLDLETLIYETFVHIHMTHHEIAFSKEDIKVERFVRA